MGEVGSKQRKDIYLQDWLIFSKAIKAIMLATFLSEDCIVRMKLIVKK